MITGTESAAKPARKSGARNDKLPPCHPEERSDEKSAFIAAKADSSLRSK
jgi:hypothetical protein